MPWTTRDAQRRTRKASTSRKRRKWAKVANKALDHYGDEGTAIRVANAAVAKRRRRGKGKRRG